jgi:hypothetical protein
VCNLGLEDLAAEIEPEVAQHGADGVCYALARGEGGEVTEEEGLLV